MVLHSTPGFQGGGGNEAEQGGAGGSSFWVGLRQTRSGSICCGRQAEQRSRPLRQTDRRADGPDHHRGCQLKMEVSCDQHPGEHVGELQRRPEL